MSVTNAALTRASPTDQLTIREVVEHLAPLERRAGSAGEREAAEWIAARLTAAGAPARVEVEDYLEGYAAPIAMLTALATAAGAAGMTRAGRRLGVVGGLAAAALIVDDVSNGPRLWRRIAAERATTWNVVAETGDPDAERTLVVLAHHDAAPTGLIFDQTFQRQLIERCAGLAERMDTSLPQWWTVFGPALLVAAGAASGRRGLTAAGAALSAVATLGLAEIAGADVVPGANDNLSAVAVLVALAEAFRDRPVEGIRVVLASMGAEEVMQGGIHGFARRHLSQLERERTWVLNADTVGSPSLIMIEGEGAVLMEDYFDRSFRDLCARVAEREGVPLRRGMRARTSTDGVIPSRMGIPTASFASVDRYKALSNYHLPSDTPENLCYQTVARMADLVEAVARELSDRVDVFADQ